MSERTIRSCFSSDGAQKNALTILITMSYTFVSHLGKRKQNQTINFLLLLGDNGTKSYMHMWYFHTNFCVLYNNIQFCVQNVSQTDNSIPKNDMSTDIIGGAPGFTAQLSMLDKSTPLENGRMFSQWMGSVKVFPEVIKMKVCLETNVIYGYWMQMSLPS